MYINAQTIITAGAVISAIAGLFGLIFKVHSWVMKQDAQTEQIEGLRCEIHKLKDENCLVCYALSAALDGLQQLGANHTVPVAKEKLDKHLNQQAHQ